jgi:aspartate aminotransferase
MGELSARTRAAAAASTTLHNFYFDSRYGEQRRAQADISDFTFGNPQEMPLAGISAAIAERARPLDKDWFAYKTSEKEPQELLAEVLTRELGLPFAPPDIAITSGAFAALAVAVRLLLDAGDEAIYSEPAWFCYEPMLLLADAVPKKVMLEGDRFDLDLEAIEAAIGPKTRLVIVNTPHNPTGRIYDRATLEALAAMLERASTQYGRRIFLISDEPYRRLRFDGNDFVSPAAIYPWTLISYSYGKVLLAPGQRLGYLAISPLMEEGMRRKISDAAFAVQMAIGWAWPNAVMQYAVPDLDKLTIDVAALTRKRDRLTAALTGAGATMLKPEGTFYLWGKWPAGNPDALWNKLADKNVFVLPGSLMNTPDWFRICLTASDSMVEKALPAFAGLGR